LENSLYFDHDTEGLVVVDQKPGLATTGEEKEYRFAVPAEVSSPYLKTTLVWTDPPGPGPGGRELVNDLNLKLKDENCQVVSNSTDNTNVEEQYVKNFPGAGVWSMSVQASNLVQGPQPFALVAGGKTGKIIISSPFIWSITAEPQPELSTVVS